MRFDRASRAPAPRNCASGELPSPADLLIEQAALARQIGARSTSRGVSAQRLSLPVCTVGDETCQLPCGPCNTRAFIYETSAARLAFTRIVHDRNTTAMSFEVCTWLSDSIE